MRATAPRFVIHYVFLPHGAGITAPTSLCEGKHRLCRCLYPRYFQRTLVCITRTRPTPLCKPVTRLLLWYFFFSRHNIVYTTDDGGKNRNETVSSAVIHQLCGRFQLICINAHMHDENRLFVGQCHGCCGPTGLPAGCGSLCFPWTLSAVAEEAAQRPPCNPDFTACYRLSHPTVDSFTTPPM